LKFILKIIYNTNSKNLENYFANCALDEVNTKTIVNYKCKIQTSTDNMKQIKFRSDFKFDQKNNIKLIGITPLAKMFMNNLQDVNDKYSNLLSYNISVYILDNCTLYEYEKYKFDIYGKILGNKP